jgi:hypothetical protein
MPSPGDHHLITGLNGIDQGRKLSLGLCQANGSHGRLVRWLVG